MKTVIMGAGAIGSLIGGLLYVGGNKETYLIGREAHAKAINDKGLIIERGEKLTIDKKVEEAIREPIKVPASVDPNKYGLADLVIITTKAYDTDAALRPCKCIINENTIVLSLQNGLGNEDIIYEFLYSNFGEEIAKKNTYGGITKNGAEFVEYGRIKYNGSGETIIGNYYELNDRKTGDMANMFNSSGIITSVSDNIKVDIWIKFLINVGINALATYHGVRNGELVTRMGLRKELIELVTEGYRVGKKLGIGIPNNIVEITTDTARKTGDNINSMLQDINKGKRTEIEYLNGKIIELAFKLGIDVPYNERYYNYIKELESQF